MKLNEYQDKAKSFAIYPRCSAQTVQQVPLYPYLGLSEESGEVAGKVGKYLRDGTQFEVLRADLRKELGDVLWMLANAASDLGLELEDIAQHNLDKLEDRRARNVIRGSGDER